LKRPNPNPDLILKSFSANSLDTQFPFLYIRHAPKSALINFCPDSRGLQRTQINAYEVALGYIPIISINSQQGEENEMDPAQASPLRKRYTAEHVNPFSKEIYGREFVRMHGAVGNDTFDVRGDRHGGDTVLPPLG